MSHASLGRPPSTHYKPGIPAHFDWAVLIIGALSLIVTVLTVALTYFVLHRRAVWWNRYNYLGAVWYDLLKVGMDNPSFLDAEKTRSWENNFFGVERIKYEAYARLSWGYIQDIYTHEFHKEGYYTPTIKACKNLHYNWLCDKYDIYFSDKEFRKFVEGV